MAQQPLFGYSPEQIMQARQAAMQERAAAEARNVGGGWAPLYEQSRRLSMMGAEGLGSGLFPQAQDPMLQKAQITQSIVNKYRGQDFNDPSVLSKMASEFSEAGQPELAMQLGEKIRSILPKTKEMTVPDKLKQKIFEIQQISPLERTAEQTKELTAAMSALGREDKSTSIEEQAKGVLFELSGLPESELTTEDKKKLRAAERVLNRGAETMKVEASGRVLLVDKETGRRIADLGAVIDRRPVTNVTVQNTAENKYAEVVGKKIAETDLALVDNAQSAARNLPKMYETRNLLEQSDLNTGIGAEVRLVIDRAKSQFLKDKKAGKRVTNTEYLDALLGSDVFPQISALGIGARGLDTPAERDYLRQVITGTITLDKQTLKQMTDLRIRGVEETINQYNKALKEGKLDQWQKTSGRSLSAIQLEQQKTSGQPGQWRIVR
jgi:hypothetical protein